MRPNLREVNIWTFHMVYGRVGRNLGSYISFSYTPFPEQPNNPHDTYLSGPGPLQTPSPRGKFLRELSELSPILWQTDLLRYSMGDIAFNVRLQPRDFFSKRRVRLYQGSILPLPFGNLLL